MNIDRRNELRIPLLLPVEYQRFDDEAGDSTIRNLSCHDLSCHGIALTSEMPLEVGEACCFSLPLSHHENVTKIKGKVCWNENLPDGREKIGVQLHEPINFPIPFPIVEKAASNLQEDADTRVALMGQALSDACLWVNPKGEIVQYDERLIAFFGCHDTEIRGKRFSDFVYPDDQKDLQSFFRKLATDGDSLPSTTLIRLQSDGNKPIFCEIRVLPKSPWSNVMEIYVRDMTEFHELKEQNNHLKQMVNALEKTMPGNIIRLNPDLTIAEVRGGPSGVKGKRRKTRFKGMDLRKATELAETRVNGKSLWNQLQSCVRTGKDYTSKSCNYPGCSGKSADLFHPGSFRATISPLFGLNNLVSSLLMIVKAEAPFGIMNIDEDKKEEKWNHFQQILGVSTAGFLLSDLLKQVCNPFTCLLAQLDLFRYKMALDRKKSHTDNADNAILYAEEMASVKKHVREISDKFKYMLENACLGEPAGTTRFDINESLSRAITIVNIFEGLGDSSIGLSSSSDLPMIESDQQEFVMIFLILLLLSRDCLRSVSDTAIRCETARDNNHIVARISHNGHIQQEKYMKILFQGNPIESYFLEPGSVHFMETILYYANLLLKKNDIKTKITNIPGHFEFSLIIPFTPEPSQR